MHSLLSPYLGQLTCGIDIDLSPCNVEDAVKSMLATSSERPDIDNMEVTPLHISIEDLRQTNKKVYIEFKLTENEVTLTKPRISTPTRSVFDVLMSHETHLPSLKLDAKTGNARKYNAVAGYVKSQKFGVPATMLSDYEEFIAGLCSLSWDINPHYYKLKSRYCSFPNVVEQTFLNFNKPQSRGHKPKQLSIQTLSLQIDKLRLHLNRGYMNGTHMTLLRNIVKGICDSLNKHVDYLKKQAVEVLKNHKTAVLPETKIEDSTIIKLKYHSYDDSAWEDRFLNLKNILSDPDFYVPVEINMHAFKDSGRRDVCHAIETLIKKGCPYRFPKSGI